MIARQRTENTTKLTICGFAPSYAKTDMKDPNNEIWLINSLYSLMEQIEGCHYERLFDLHRSQYIIQQDQENTHLKKMQELISQGVKVFTCEEIPGMDTCIYPLDEIEKMVGISYFTNTITYLILLAAYEYKMGYWPNLQEVHINGVDMAQDGEFSHQRPSCELAIGFLRGMGIKVVIPAESDLCKSVFKYGYDLNPCESKIFREKIENHQKQIDELRKQRAKITAQRNQQISQIEGRYNQEINQIDAYIQQLSGAIDMSKYYARALFSQSGVVTFSPQLEKYDKTNFRKLDILD